jgi:hypothetical protein
MKGSDKTMAPTDGQIGGVSFKADNLTQQLYLTAGSDRDLNTTVSLTFAQVKELCARLTLAVDMSGGSRESAAKNILPVDKKSAKAGDADSVRIL